MANFEEENAQLRAELAAMKEDLAKAHDAMSTMMAAQEQPATSIPASVLSWFFGCQTLIMFEPF